MAPPHPAGQLQAASRHRWLDLLASPSPRRRLRLLHWLIACLVYVGIAVLLVVGMDQGWMRYPALLGWSCFVGTVLLLGAAGASPAQAQQVLFRVQATVRDRLRAVGPVTFSAGVAAHRGSEPVEALLSRADAALYEAKHAGRDRLALAGP